MFRPLIKINVAVLSKQERINFSNSVYDPGSTFTLVSSRLVKQLGAKTTEVKVPFETVSGEGTIKSRANLQLTIGKLTRNMNLFVVEGDKFKYDILIGLNAIAAFRLIQDDRLRVWQRDGYTITRISERKKLKADCDGPVVNFNEFIDTTKFEANLNHLSSKQRKQVEELIEANASVFARHKYDIGRVRSHEARIRLSEKTYVAMKPYKCSLRDQKLIEEQVEGLKEHDLIEDSTSPFAAPVTLVDKKEAGESEPQRTRLVVDLRGLNKLVIPEAQPFPRIEDILVRAGNAKYWSSFDINSAFWTIPVRRKDRHKVAFVTQSGHYQWKVLPFGLKSSSAIFQRILSSIIRKYKLNGFCCNYIDDILVWSSSFEEHLKHIQQLMTAIQLEGLKLKFMKCSFAQRCIKYLGHLIKPGKVSPVNDNLKAIREFATPKSKRDVRRWLGKINFYYKFIRDPVHKLEPLYDLLRGDKTRFVWTKEADRAFESIKDYLCSSPVLAIFDPSKKIIVQTDASSAGIGAVLKQPDQNGDLHPVAYFSKRLSPTQKKKPVTYQECLAIKEAVVYWQHWLLGAQFSVVTDHKPLESMRTNSRVDEPLGELINYLSQYDFDVIYTPGKDNLEADDLSRNPVLEASDQQDDGVINVANLITLDEIRSDQSTNRMEIEKARNVIEKNGLKYKRLNGRERIFISKKLGDQLIDRTHNHFGDTGTGHLAGELRRFYYFRNLDRSVRAYCRKCLNCLKNKTRKPRDLGLLSKLGPPERPYQILSVDTIGGFSDSFSKKRYLHLLADHFSRHAWIRTSARQTTKEFIKLIEPVVSSNDVEIVLADQYTGLNSKKLKECLARHGTELIFTSVDSPESNGLNERLNQTLVNRIRCKTNAPGREHRSWARTAEQCVEEYNRTRHSSTGFAPGYLLYGSASSIIPDELHEKGDLEADRRTAAANSRRAFEANKRRVDRNRRDYEFKPGDLVIVHGGSKLNRGKLNPVRRGPFKVLRRLSNSIYEVASGKRKQEANLYHSVKLMPFPRPLLPSGGEV